MVVYANSKKIESLKDKLVPCLPLQSAKYLLAATECPSFRRVMLPFNSPSTAVIETALDMTTQRELVLLYVEHDVEMDEEKLFTTLRGLQAQTQQAGSEVEVDSLIEDTAVSLLDYAHKHHIDLILLPDEQVTD